MTDNDCKHLVREFENLKNIKPEFISTSYPGAFYRKTCDDSKVKVFQRGSTMKIFIYPNYVDRLDKINDNLEKINTKLDKINDLLNEIKI